MRLQACDGDATSMCGRASDISPNMSLLEKPELVPPTTWPTRRDASMRRRPARTLAQYNS